MLWYIRDCKVPGHSREHPKALSCFEKPSLSCSIKIVSLDLVMRTQRRGEKLMNVLQPGFCFAVATRSERLKSVHEYEEMMF